MPLEPLIRLRDLKVQHNSFKSLAPLTHLLHLKNLDISYCNAIEDFEMLGNLSSLQRLKMRSVGIQELGTCPHDLHFIHRLRSLIEGVFSENCWLTNISVLQGHPSLRLLNLYGCHRIQRYTYLQYIPHLTEVTVHKKYPHLKPDWQLPEFPINPSFRVICQEIS